jgi:hypothetical protein
MLAVGGTWAGLCYQAALADGKVPPVKLAELVLLVQRRRRVNFHRLLGHDSPARRIRPRRAQASRIDRGEVFPDGRPAGPTHMDSVSHRVPPLVSGGTPSPLRPVCGWPVCGLDLGERGAAAKPLGSSDYPDVAGKD